MTRPLRHEWGSTTARPPPQKIIPSKTAQNPHVNPPPHSEIAKTPINTGDFTRKLLA
jgi:hypothetical protein